MTNKNTKKVFYGNGWFLTVYNDTACPFVESTGVTGNKSLRPELQGQKEFKDFAGPMWGGVDESDGETIIRYETWELYESNSN